MLIQGLVIWWLEVGSDCNRFFFRFKLYSRYNPHHKPAVIYSLLWFERYLICAMLSSKPIHHRYQIQMHQIQVLEGVFKVLNITTSQTICYPVGWHATAEFHCQQHWSVHRLLLKQQWNFVLEYTLPDWYNYNFMQQVRLVSHWGTLFWSLNCVVCLTVA